LHVRVWAIPCVVDLGVKHARQAPIAIVVAKHRIAANFSMGRFAIEAELALHALAEVAWAALRALVLIQLLALRRH